MIKITLFLKSNNKKEDFVEKSSFSIERPKTYEDLVKKIKINFNISNDDFALRVFDEDIDEYINVNYDEQYNDPKYKSITNYRVFLEENPPKIDENIFEFIDRTLNLKNDLLIDDTELFDKFDFSTESSEDNKLGLSIKDLMNENLDEEKTEQNELYNYFIDDFSKKISNQTEEQKKLFIESINKDLLNLDKVINENVDEFNKQAKLYSEKINILNNDVNELKNIIINDENSDQQKKKEEEERKRKEEEQKKKEEEQKKKEEEQKKKEEEEQKRKEEEEQKKKEEEEQKKKEEEEQKKKEEEERKRKEEEERKKKEEEERKKKEEEERKKKEEEERKMKEEEERKMKEEEERKKKEEEERKRKEEEEQKKKEKQKPEKLEIKSKEKYIIEDTNASDILVQVKVKNVSEKKISLKNKKWVKGKKSNEAVDFINGIDEININEELEENKEKNIDVHFSIKNPQQGLNYNVELLIGNIKDNNEIDIITENALCFNVEITKKKNDDPNALSPEKIEEIYQALEDSYAVSSFLDKQDLVDKIIKLKGDMDLLNEYVEGLI